MARQRQIPTLLPAILLLGLTTFATTEDLAADEVVMRNGTIHIGKTKKVGKHVIITTLDGTVRVKSADIDWQRTRDDEQLRDALERIAMRSGAGSCHAQLELARVAKAWGLHDEMWGYLGRVLRSTHHHSKVMTRRTQEFMAGLEKVVLPKKWRNARPEIKVRELLYRIKRRVPKAKLAAVSALLAHVPESDAPLKKRARRVTNTLQRTASVKALALRPTAGNDRFVYRTAILDASPQVRQEAMQISKSLGRAKAAIEYLAPLLLHDNAKFRVRAARAFGELRDPAAVPLLVAAGPAAGMMRRSLPGGATRAHMAVIQQISYIRDFDVQVAQASFIADPQVDVLHAGTVLDVTVIAVKTHTVKIIDAYRGAIRRIVNADPGPDPKTWDAWLKKREELGKARVPAITPGGVRAKKG